MLKSLCEFLLFFPRNFHSCYEFSVNWISMFREQDRQRERYIVKSETVAESESGGITYSLSARLHLNICRLFNSPFTLQLVFHLHASGIMTSCLQLNLEGTKINEFGR